MFVFTETCVDFWFERKFKIKIKIEVKFKIEINTNSNIKIKIQTISCSGYEKLVYRIRTIKYLGLMGLYLAFLGTKPPRDLLGP